MPLMVSLLIARSSVLFKFYISNVASQAEASRLYTHEPALHCMVCRCIWFKLRMAQVQQHVKLTNNKHDTHCKLVLYAQEAELADNHVFVCQ